MRATASAPEGGDAHGHHRTTVAAADMFSQVVVECANALSVGVHGFRFDFLD